MIPFTGNPLDRAGERRGDAQWLAERRRDPAIATASGPRNSAVTATTSGTRSIAR